MERVIVFDTTLRDGEQSPGASMTPAEKLRFAVQLEELGVDVIEAGFPASSPADAAGVREIGRNVRGCRVAALARTRHSDIDEAAAALEHAHAARLHVFIATSEIHLRSKLRITRAECIDRAVSAIERARRYIDDVEFSAEDATRSDPEFLREIVAAVIEAGAGTINLPDTVGYAHPQEMATLIRTLYAGVPRLRDVVVSVHCHDDLGMAVANSLSGVEAGARQIECTINGIGERAGNAALEEVVMALHTRRDVYGYETRVQPRHIYRTSQLLSAITGIHPQPNKAIVGRNAFAHEAGIHQDGMIKDRTTYEIMTPESVGVPESNLVLGRHSGRNALERRYKTLGYALPPEDFERAYHLFKLLAEQKKSILDEDLIAILHHGAADDLPQRYRLRHLEVVCGTLVASAEVHLTIDGKEQRARAEGDGPLAASFAAINKIAEHRIELQELAIQAITPGADAVGEVHLRAKIDGRTFTGRGAAPDVVNAAVRAYIHALNKASQASVLEAESLERESYAWGV
jgi:2-isopropylmalate synthase